MVDFISKFYAKTDVKPEEVEFVETYGCGHKVRDQAMRTQFINVYL